MKGFLISPKNLYLDLLRRIEKIENSLTVTVPVKEEIKTPTNKTFLKLKSKDKLIILRAIESLKKEIELTQGLFLISIGFSKRNYRRAKLLKKFIGIFWTTKRGSRRSTIYKII